MIKRNDTVIKVIMHQRSFRSVNLYLQNNAILTDISRIKSLIERQYSTYSCRILWKIKKNRRLNAKKMSLL